MWFPDPPCRAMFGVSGMIDAAHLGAFAKCVATVQLAPSPHEGALPDVGVVTYGPQLELEVLFARDGGASRVKWIGYVSQQRPDDARRRCSTPRSSGPRPSVWTPRCATPSIAI